MSRALPTLDMSGLAAVTVTFRPDLGLLQRQLDALANVPRIIVVDNGSPRESVDALRTMLAMDARILLVEHADNLGLAAALNAGVDRARAAGASSVLLLDQDSTFEVDAPGLLLQAVNALQAQTGRLCCAGPALRDPVTHMVHGFHHVADGWRWARSYPAADAPPFAVDNLNGSGTTMAMAMVDAMGPLDASFFIDHVDTEWSFRVLHGGGALYGIPSVTFDHRMGERGRRIWLLGWRVWPERSPLRHYYLFRNTLRLMRRAYVPFVWRAWAAAKMAATVTVVGITDPRRADQLAMMWKGFREGFRER